MPAKKDDPLVLADIDPVNIQNKIIAEHKAKVKEPSELDLAKEERLKQKEERDREAVEAEHAEEEAKEQEEREKREKFERRAKAQRRKLEAHDKAQLEGLADGADD